MNPFTNFLFLLPLLHVTSSTTICTTKLQIPHFSVILPFSIPTRINLPLHLTHPCILQPSTPLLLLLPGGLTRPNDYHHFTKSLTKRGFITALPDYTTRPITTLPLPQIRNLSDHVSDTINNGFDCPSNTQSVTVAVLHSVLSWFSHRGNTVSKAADLMNVMVFGHSQGGAIVNFFLSNTCIPFTQPVNGTLQEILRDPNRVGELFPRLFCEQYNPSIINDVRVVGVVTYEGLTPGANITVPRQSFHIAMHSGFAQGFTNLSERIVGEGKMVRMRIDDANHYGVNDFYPGNQTPPCALVRPPPENAFRTCGRVQNQVVETIVTVVFAAFQALVKGRFVKVVATKIREIEIVQ